MLAILMMTSTMCAWAQNVAKISETEYATLKAAVNDATNGQTITLMADVTIPDADQRLTITKPLRLDMASHTITSNIEEPFIIDGTGDKRGALTITGNGTITGLTGAEAAAHDGHAMITVMGAQAHLTFINGTMTCGGAGSDGMYGVYILDSGTAVFGEQSGHTGPSITAWFAAIGENNTTAPAHITIYGGTYKQDATPSESDWWEYFCAPVYASASGTVTIEGGKFTGRYAFASRYGNVEQTIRISGGEFKGTESALLIGNVAGDGQSGTRDIEISGGTFSSEIPSEVCADGFVVENDGTGTYGVLYDLQMTDATTLASLSAQNGKTVKATYTRNTGMVGAGSTTGTQYGTICLPFTINAAITGVRLYKATGISASALTITEVTDFSSPIPASTPLIFELSAAATTLTVTSSYATVSTAVPATEPAGVGNNLLVGTYNAATITSGLGSIYYLNGDKFHQAKVSLAVPAYHAYIKAPASPARPMVLSIVKDGDEDVTGIDHTATMDSVTAVYDLNGRKLEGLQHGINIMRRADGSTLKVVVK